LPGFFIGCVRVAPPILWNAMIEPAAEAAVHLGRAVVLIATPSAHQAG